MILEAEKRGELRPGGLVVEATAGNTGIGLALVANARGYRTLIVIPQTQSEEKKDTLRLCGAELVEVPALPFSNPNNYSACRPPSRRTAQEDREERRHLRRSVEQPRQQQGALRLDRSGDLGAHRRQDRRLHLRHRHRRHARRRVALLARKTRTSSSALADPRGAAMYNLFAHGEAKSSDGGSITEGIGLGPHHADRQRRDRRQGLSHSRRGSRADHFRSALARRTLPRRLIRHQCRRRHSPGERSRPRPHHRDGAGRFRHALSVQAVQSRLPALEKPAGAGMAGAQDRISIPFEKT